jgi:adenylate kinase
MRVLFLGPPGSGKGTQAKLLAQRLRVPAVSTGEILRAAAAAGTPLGREVKAVMDRGELVSDAVMIDLVKDRLLQPDAARGFLLDGFPRTVAQAQALEDALGRNEIQLSGVVNLTVPEEMLLARLASRAAMEGRSDDRPETARERLRVYREKTEPLVAFYRDRGLLIEVNGVGEIPAIAEAIEGHLSRSVRGQA